MVESAVVRGFDFCGEVVGRAQQAAPLRRQRRRQWQFQISDSENGKCEGEYEGNGNGKGKGDGKCRSLTPEGDSG